MRLPDHERRLAQARARASWELGDGSWADLIVDAYLNPEMDADLLAKDQAEDPDRD